MGRERSVIFLACTIVPCTVLRLVIRHKESRGANTICINLVPV
jgi:hypothetical protein